ncbi:MAG: HAD-IA family hydrolase [Cyclobacteriaceae bacterium]
MHKNVLFDLDGTIIEPEEGIINSVLFALNKLGIKEDDRVALRSFIGPPLTDSFTERYQLSETRALEAVKCYREFFSEKGILQNTLYDGVVDMLEELAGAGFRLFVATSKPTFYAEKIISRYGLDKYFEAVVGSNMDNTRKDKTEIIKHVITEYKLNSHETVMVGDRKYDIIGAHDNLIRSIGVS